MPKVTVYIPDELLERTRRLPDGEKTSHIVQRGLARLLDDQVNDDPPAYAIRPDGAEEKILALREKFIEEAEREYATGYEAAIDVADGIPLSSVDQLARQNFDVPRWLKGYVDAARNELMSQSGEEIPLEKIVAMSLEEVAEHLRLPQPRPDETPWWWVWRLAKTLGMIADPIGYDETAFNPTNARVRGFTDGLRDLWDAIESPGSSRIDRAVDFQREWDKRKREWNKKKPSPSELASQMSKELAARRARSADQKTAREGGDDR